MIDKLGVWLYGTRLATLERDSGRGRLSLHYSEEAIERFGLASPILSASMPLRREPYPNARTRDFFDGLLPEGDARTLIARELGIADTDTFSFMRELGRDSAGAIVVQEIDAEAPTPRSTSQARRIDQVEVAARLDALPRVPLGVDEEVRLSLAGVQGKLLLTRHRNGWALPSHDVPSTHILKPQIPNPEWPGTVGNEALCMRLAAAVGLPVARVEVEELEGNKVLVVERFDRAIVDGEVQRLHQEDGCQALGRPPRQKYQEQGGPSLRELAALLNRYGDPGERRNLLALATFNVAVGNADAHGKNYSFLHAPDGSVGLAPAYDLMCTIAYPLSRRMGMTVDGVGLVDRVTPERLVSEGMAWGLPPAECEEVVGATLRRIDASVEEAADEDGADPAVVELLRRRAADLVDRLPAAGSPLRPGLPVRPERG